MTKKYPYESCFAELIIKPLVSEAKDKCLALASLVEVRNFLPLIDTTANLDLLPVAFNACVVNRVNKNKDVIDTATAVAMYPHFINKPINVEHNRQRVIGVILAAGFSEFGTDRPLTEEQVKGMTSPFNITLGGIVWRIVSPDLSDHIEESNDPTSANFLSVSASWELGFSNYRIALLGSGLKNLSEAKIVSDPEEIAKIQDKLTALGGDGKLDDLFAYRMPSYDVLPLGIGFTEKPAAEVKGVATQLKEQANITQPETFHESPEQEKLNAISSPESTKVIPTINIPYKETFGENENKISQSPKLDVKIKRNVIMKINSLTDITDDNLKECSASAISDFISAELKKGSDTWEGQKNALNTQLAQAQADSKKLLEEQTKLQEQFNQVQATVATLQAERLEREKVEKFNVRMAEINDAYELDDEVRAALVEDIKALASDEDYAKWQGKAKVLLKGFAKKAKVADKDKGKEMHEGEDCEGKKAKAKAASDDAIASVLDNATQDKGGLPNGSAAAQQTLKEKYSAAFAKENFVITS